MENIFLPSKIEYTEGDAPNTATLTIEPLFHGYGTTLANSLRRVMLSSMPGAAVTAVKIKGVNHEFEAVNGVFEDALEITLNLKQLRMKVFSDEPVKLHLKKKGEGKVTAADFDKDSNVEIANPELVIAEITDKNSEFEMEVIVQKGMGFDPTESRDKSNKEVGLIEIDAIYSPVRHVGYKVEDTRVGQITNYDKITMTIETDGTITPKEAVERSASILINHLNLLSGSLGSSMPTV